MKACALVLGLTLVASEAVRADTLVLAGGRRIQGELIAVVGQEIEFEERAGQIRRMLRVRRDEIVRIEFTEGQLPSSAPAFADQGGAAGPVIPRGMRERIVNVVGNQRWIDTGVDVRGGQELYFMASGEVRWGPRNRKDGAAGERNSPVNHLRPIPDRPAAALIARIGEGEDIFFIGADIGPFRARQSGRLFLGINDDWLEDNTGSLRVKVSY